VGRLDPSDPELLAERTKDPVEALVAEQESAAAAEAREIGGMVPSSADDPAMEPVYEAGGGVAEGFEQAEADLIENAQHYDGPGDPLRDAFTPEAESDRATGLDAEGNRLLSTEVTFDPDEDPDTDPGADRSSARSAEGGSHASARSGRERPRAGRTAAGPTVAGPTVAGRTVAARTVAGRTVAGRTVAGPTGGRADRGRAAARRRAPRDTRGD
jgi:hypothetical protein